MLPQLFEEHEGEDRVRDETESCGNKTLDTNHIVISAGLKTFKIQQHLHNENVQSRVLDWKEECKTSRVMNSESNIHLVKRLRAQFGCFC